MSPGAEPSSGTPPDPLAPFSDPVRRWFEGAFEAPDAGPDRRLGGDFRR